MRPALLLGALLIAGCGDDPATAEPRATDATFDASTLIDTAIAPADSGEDGWGYALASEADLTGDGIAERAVLMARVEMHRGRPAWDDGQPWQVYVELPNGERRRIYAQRLQLGTLRLRTTLPHSGGPATLILIEHLPDRLRIFEVSFDAAGQPSVRQLVERLLDPVGQPAAPQLP